MKDIINIPTTGSCSKPQEVTINYGANAKDNYELWLTLPGNAGKTLEQYFDSLKADGNTPYWEDYNLEDN